MRVLMFGWEYPPHITGGLGTACHGLSTALSHMVSKITFVLPRIKAPISHGAVDLMSVADIPLMSESFSTAWIPELEVFCVDSSLKPYLSEEEYLRHMAWLTLDHEATQKSTVSAPSLVQLSGDYGANLFEEVFRYARLAAQLVTSRPFDVIHAHDWMTFLAGVEAKRLSGKKLIVHVHALECDRSGPNIDQRVYDIERRGMEEADHIIAVSHRTKEQIVSQYGIDQAKITVVHNGIANSSEELAAPAHQRRLPLQVCVFLGRITQQKGPEYFLEAAYLVTQKYPDVRFVMAGCGDLLPHMITRMAELKLIKNFHFTGFVNEEARDQLLSEADLFVMPSVSEPFGLSPLEALQHGVPVIVAKQSGVSEVLNHAIKVDFWDVRRIADAMIKVLSIPALKRQLQEGAPEDLAGLSWDHAAAKVMQIYREVV
jgi:glycogen(starch) synthase